MSIASANPDDLHSYGEGATARILELDELRQGVQATQDSVIEGSPSAGIHPRALTVLHGLLADGLNTATWVAAIREALLAADSFDSRGVASLTDRALDDAIGEGPPGVQAYEIQPLVFSGVPQTSGYVDDPVNAWTGNFVHGETDLRIHGASAPASVHRMYNSAAAPEPGIFGLGWTCLLDMSVNVGDKESGPVVRLSDGAHLPFDESAEDPTAYRCGWRRHVRLDRTAAGWRLTDGSATTWSFDGDGLLTGGFGHGHDLLVTRSPGLIEVTDRLTGRAVAYELQAGLVRGARTDDGRRADYLHDDAGRLISATTPAGASTYELDEAGRVLAVVDADGVSLVRNTYDVSGRVIGQVSPHGRTTTYTYTGEGVTTVADVVTGGGRNVLVHDRRGNLLAVFDGEGHAIRRTYDDRDRITSVTDRRGNLTSYVWDDADNLVSRRTADGAVTRWQHDELGRVTLMTDPGGVTTALSYRDAFDIPVVASTPSGDLLIELDDLGRPVLISDADAVTSQLEWTSDSLIASITDAEGQVTTYDYDARGQLISVHDADGQDVQIDVDAAGRLVGLHGPDGVERVVHTAAGRIAGIHLPGGEQVTIEHDRRGRPHRMSRGKGGAATFHHDRFGHLVEVQDAMGGIQRTSYDLVGRLTQTIDRAGHVTAVVYDPDGNSVEVHTPDGRSWTREVDVHGRTTALTAPGGAVERRTYHLGGQLASVTDGLGNVTRFELDESGRTVAKVDPLGHTTRWTYTPAGRIHAIEHPGGLLQLAAYDQNGRMTGTVGPGGTREVPPSLWEVQDDSQGEADARMTQPLATYGVDSRGLLGQVTDPAGVTTRLTRNLLGHVTATLTGDVGFSLERSPEGWLIGTTDALGRRTAIERDDAGRPLVLRRAGSSGRRHVLDQAGRVAQVTDLDGGLLAEHRWDALGQLLGGTVHSAQGPVELERQLDAVGRIVTSTDPSGTTTYAYDQVGRLQQRVDPGGVTTTLLRGPGGQITTHRIDLGDDVREVPAPQTLGVVRDSLGRVTTDAKGRRFAYDNAGRLVRTVLPDGRVTEWEYDELGRLAAERRHDADTPLTIRRYDYDLTGRLTVIHDDERSTLIFHDDAGRRTEERSADGRRRQFTFDDMDRLVRITTTGPDGPQVTRTIQWDVLGRPVQVDETMIGHDDVITGKPVRVGDRRYVRHGLQVRELTADAWDDGTGDDPWGADRAMDGVALGYRGELVVDGLVLMGARVYDPATRSFLSVDPMAAVPGRLCHAAPYAYAEHDPVNLVDPTGLRPLSEAEMRDYLDAVERNIFQAAGHAIAEDPWKFLLSAAVVAAGAALVVASGGTLLPLVGAGIAMGGSAAALTGVATRSLDADSVLFGAAAGGVTGPLLGPLSGWGAVGAEAAVSVPVNVLDHTVIQGQPIGEISPTTLLVGAVASGGLRGLGEFGPSGAGLDAPTGPRPAPPTTTSMGSEFGDAPLRMVEVPPLAPRPPIPATGSRVVSEMPVFGPPTPPTMTPVPGTFWSTPTGAIELPSGLLVPPTGVMVPTPAGGNLLGSGLWVPGDPG